MLPPISPNLHVHNDVECLKRRVGGRFRNCYPVLHHVGEMLGSGGGALYGLFGSPESVFAFVLGIEELLAG
jgi:hypothetical protein